MTYIPIVEFITETYSVNQSSKPFLKGQRDNMLISICIMMHWLTFAFRALYKGMEVECYDWNAYDESRQWFREKDHIEEKKDGINLRTKNVGSHTAGLLKKCKFELRKRETMETIT